ncbi:MAG TPA: hypothetical protein VGT44_12790 [Ktedonobacteraceae bacterium]|nr:hypothetical protein [Ktedonobacteraceae bacterium]
MAFTINPEQVASYEAAGWRAYYDRKWLKMLRLILQLVQEQFHIPFPMSLFASYYTARASQLWAPVNHDEQKVLAYLTKFYGVARRYSGLRFDVEEVARLELQYFEVHRRLSGQPEKEEFLQTLVALHSAIFALSPEAVRESAEWRLKAANIVDLITSRTSSNIEEDWKALEEYLRRCYAAIQKALDAAASAR